MIQSEFLRAAQKALEMSRKEFADAIGTKVRAMANWYLPPDSKGFRSMPEKNRMEVERLLREKAQKDASSGDWLSNADVLSRRVEERDHVQLPWEFAGLLVQDFKQAESGVVQLYATPIAAWVADKGAGLASGEGLRPLAERMQLIVSRNPDVFSSKQHQANILKELPRAPGMRKKYATFEMLLEAFSEKLASSS